MKINFIFICLLVIGCKQNDLKDNVNGPLKKPKNIILLIGDGMGISQVSSAIYYKKSKSNFERFPIVGLSKTSSSSHKITDSGAGATAISIGEKSYNGSIGVASDSLEKELITKFAKDLGKKIGIISTSAITHATPASFYSHSKSRSNAEEIAQQINNYSFDFFAGGGLQYFRNRSDSVNLLDILKDDGYYIDTNELQMTKSKKAIFLLADDGMPKISEGRSQFLKNASLQAIEHLKNDNGLFLMIEGSQIDWGGHANDSEYLISELIDFDNTMGSVLDWAEKDGETLVIVTADHETGGFTLSANPNKDYNNISPTFSTSGHSGAMVGVFAYGPGAEKFSGIYENTQIHHKMKMLLK
ncbi:alkaline phosphatase [Candidatus Kapabacteria bacterium]|nr:alkaline phosphatase [Candidatus Kapabacteria bacterium]